MPAAKKRPARVAPGAAPKPEAAPWNAVVVDLGDGHRVVVGRSAIEQDYADYLHDADGLTRGHAIERARDPLSVAEIETWVREQFNRADFIAKGTPISLPSYEMLLAGVDTSENGDLQFVLL